MKQFDLKEYLANPSRKVVTRDGRKVRILCTDREDLNFPIITLIKKKLGGEEVIYAHTQDGLYCNTCSTIHDLFFAPEKHEGWVNLYKGLDKDHAYYLGDIYNSKAEAENGSSNNNYKYIATIRIEWEE